VAVASRDGKTVHLHFGRAEQFLIFDVAGERAHFLEKRRVTPACRGGVADEDDRHSVTGMEALVESLADCQAVLVRRIGPAARERLESRGITAYVTPDFIPEALAALVRGTLIPARAVER
jgi:predicted Fe-Mo cluster-binding NifX family protein